MDREIGDKSFPIWLLGDSNPKNWESKLNSPFDARHPARHNIWTPIVDEIQEHLFIQRRSRLKTSTVYIRNAIENANNKPKRSAEWQVIEQESQTGVAAAGHGAGFTECSCCDFGGVALRTLDAFEHHLCPRRHLALVWKMQAPQ